MKRDTIHDTFIDPVCGMEVSRKAAVEEAEYKGRVYYFCAKACRETFEADPERFVSKRPPGQDRGQ